VLAFRYAVPLGHLLPFDVPPLIRVLCGGAAIVVLGVVAAAIIGRLLRTAVAASHLAGADRVLGAMFGAIRGGLVALLITWIFIEAGLSESRYWRNSTSGPYLEHVYHWMAGTIPNRRVPLVMNSGA